MKNETVFETENINFPTLEKNVKCDALIIGGGITGFSTLYHLNKSNLKVVLVEQNKIGGETTKRSTGKLNYLQNDLLYNINKSHGFSKFKLYLESQIEAINKITALIKEENIDCNLERTESIIYTNKKEDIKKINFLKNILIKCNINVEDTKPNLVKSLYAIKCDNSYIFNPLKFLINLSKKIKNNIYENTKIIKIEKVNNYYLCYTKNKIIKTKYVIIANHYPFFLIPYFFPVKASLEKSYISASNYKKDKISLINFTNPFISIRTYKDKLIYLSNSHDISKNINDFKNYQELLKKLKDLNLKPTNLWSNIDVMSNDYLPYIGKIKNNLFLATGYNTWGLTNGFLAGNIISDIILNRNNKYISLFDPKRKNLKMFLGSITSIKNNIISFIKGIKYGKHKCTHLKCRLIYNKIDNTYDCPCHGSRFDKNGNVVSGPALKKITF